MSGKFQSDTGVDFSLEVRPEAGGTCVKVRLPGAAERCYRLFSDADHMAEWLVVVGNVVVRRRDEKGRALEAEFLGSLQRASVAYSLTYEYDDDALEVRWQNKSGSVRKLAGSARFLREGERSCRLEYRLTTELPQNLPPWADELYRSRPAETVVLDFCEWLEDKVES